MTTASALGTGHRVTKYKQSIIPYLYKPDKIMSSPPARFTPPFRRYASAWLYAVLIALLFNVGFVYLFRPNPHTSIPTTPMVENPECVLIQIDAPQSKIETEIAAYAHLADPTIMALPHPNIGLINALPNSSTERMFNDLPSYSFEITPEPQKEPTTLYNFDETAPPPLPAFSTKTLKNWKYTLPTPKKIPQQPLPKNIIWRFPSGKPIEPTPELTANEMEESIDPTLRQTLSAPTTLRVNWLRTDLPRVVVETSSGTPELDQLAARAIMRWLGRKHSTIPDNTLIEVEWRLKSTATP